MKDLIRFSLKRAVGMLSFVTALSIGCAVPQLFLGLHAAQAKMIGGVTDGGEAAVELDRSHPKVREVMAIQNRHTALLMSHPDVVGTATGLDDAGQPAVLVFTRKEVADGVLPADLEGKRVIRKISGEIRAMLDASAKKVRIDPVRRFDRPVPIGVSTGNEGECSAGTIGARVKDSSRVYALSNNHVYALENNALPGSQVLQPGRYDTRCAMSSADVIGRLSRFVPIDFSVNNGVDAAIAETDTGSVGTATPANGYGVPKSATTMPALAASVQKYGRTSGLTKGMIVGINTTIRVGYSAGTATFVNQITVNGKGFIKSGDSGSLLVTDPGRNPVGLLFAGNGSGSYAFANPIDEVLDSLKVSIDGE